MRSLIGRAPWSIAAIALCIVVIVLFGLDGDDVDVPATTTTLPVSTTTVVTTTTLPVSTTTVVTTTPTTIPTPVGRVFPTAESTGVPADVILQGAPGTIRVTPSGVTIGGTPTDQFTTDDGSIVIDGWNVDGNVIVTAPDVTIRNSRIEGPGNRHVVECTGDCSDLLIEDTTIRGTSDNAQNCIAFRGYTARRVQLSGCIDGAKANGDVLIENSYIFSLRRVGSSHNDGVQSTGGNNVRIIGNTIIHDTGGQTSDTKLTSENARLTNAELRGNRLIVSTCFAVYFNDKNGLPTPTGVVADNVISGHTCDNWLSLDSGPDQFIGDTVTIDTLAELVSIPVDGRNVVVLEPAPVSG